MSEFSPDIVDPGDQPPEETIVTEQAPHALPPRVLRGQAWWVLPSLLLILATALTLYSWRLGSSGLSTYYASSAKSMADNWRAFAFGALDPGSSWTLDKLSGFLVPQALAIKLFGFHPWVLDLPEVIEGLVTVFVSYLIGARWRGPAFGIVVAATMTLTPLLAAMFGHPTEDAMLTMTMVLAFAAWQRSVLSGRFGWLLLAGFWIAVGFQAKMLQAWLIVPALLIGFVVGTTGPLRRRLGRAIVAGAVTAALSMAWIAGIQLVPASDRPFVDGSTNNNAFSMVFAYNGTDRIVPGLIPGGVPQLAAHTATPGHGTATQATGHLPTKMLLPAVSTQIGWLYPSAAVGALLALDEFRRRRRRRAVSGDPVAPPILLTAAVWLGLTSAVLSIAFVPHASYFGVVALPLALFSTAGLFGAVAHFRMEGRARWLLPALVAAQTLWAASSVLSGAPATRWLAALLLGAGVAATVGSLVVGRRSARASGAGRPFVIAAAMVAVLLGPAIWSSFVLGPGGAGSASDAYAGPRPDAAAPPARSARSSTDAGAAESRLLHYIDSHGAGEVRFVTDTMAVAVAVNLDTGDEVIPMGGFSGQAPWLTSRALSHEVDSGRVRYVLLSDAVTAALTNPTLESARTWTRSRCTPVLHGRFRAGSGITQTLYDCRA
jgi:4-amino-4-deoxy-L-arabinose transferase-like glycosyltransferase